MTMAPPRPQEEARSAGAVQHPHYGLGWIAVIAIFTAFAGVAIGIAALIAIANRAPVDTEVVTALVNQQLEEQPARAAQADTVTTAPAEAAPVAAPPLAAPFGDIIPELTPKAQLAPAPAEEINVAYAPDVPPPATRTDQRIVTVEFEIVENVVAIDPETGVEFETWGYRLPGEEVAIASGSPGPMVRARVGDVVRFTLTNPSTNQLAHNVDFHAITGQGGGAADTLVAPGETAVIEARALYPGIFMYHCAAGDVPAHIAHGMYGGILIDPEVPLPAADREFYIVQSEYYTTSTEPGLVDLDREALTAEHPTMVVFNGAKGALAGDNALEMAVGERARFYFVNAGLNLDSNFHPIGSHWDAVWPEGATYNQPIRGSQTTLVPAGGGVVVDMLGQVPSTIILVDHALARTFDKGAIGLVNVVGEANPEIFEASPGAAAPVDATTPATGDVSVAMLPGSWEPQDLGDPAEFANDESPVDYSTNILTVPVGTTVVWVNEDDQVHTVTEVNGEFDSGLLNPGDSWAMTFDAPGEYEYFCIPHPWMRAKVIVTEA